MDKFTNRIIIGTPPFRFKTRIQRKTFRSKSKRRATTKTANRRSASCLLIELGKNVSLDTVFFSSRFSLLERTTAKKLFLSRGFCLSFRSFSSVVVRLSRFHTRIVALAKRCELGVIHRFQESGNHLTLIVLLSGSWERECTPCSEAERRRETIQTINEFRCAVEWFQRCLAPEVKPDKG